MAPTTEVFKKFCCFYTNYRCQPSSLYRIILISLYDDYTLKFISRIYYLRLIFKILPLLRYTLCESFISFRIFSFEFILQLLKLEKNYNLRYKMKGRIPRQLSLINRNEKCSRYKVD